MGLLGTVKAALQASAQTSPGDDAAVEGAYWCDECDVRIRAADVDDDTPTCPECGAEMRFERSPGSTSCAC